MTHAAEVPGRTLDGPNEVNLSLQDVSLAADGTGAVTYLKEDGQDVPHVVRRSGGAWGSPLKVVDSAQDITKPQGEASNGGRLMVVYLRLGDLEARISPGTGQPFGAVIPLASNISALGADTNDAGVGYIVARTNGNDVRAWRVTGNSAAPVGATIDTSPGPSDPVVAVDGAGNAVAAYEKDLGGGVTGVVAKRLTGTTAGAAIEATVPSLGGLPRAAGAQNVGIVSDLAGNAWVSFREQFAYPVVLNRNRPLVRRLSGNTFGPALLVDSGPTPPLDMTDAEFIRLAVAPNGANALASGFIQNNVTNKPPLFGASLTAGAASPFPLEAAPSDGAIASANGIVNGGSGFIAYSYQPPGSANYVVRARLRSGIGAFAAPIPVSNAALGNVDGSANPFAAADASNTGVVAYSQGAAAQKRVLAATLDIPQPAAGGGGGGGDTTDPAISRFSLSRTTFRKGTRLPKISAVKTGTTIRFRLSEAATVRLTFEKAARGRRVGKSCRKPTRRNRTRKRCTRYVRVRTRLSVKGKAGANKLAFQGRLTRRRSLSVGRYRFFMSATDSSKNVSKRTARKRFRLLRAARKRKR